MSGQVRSGSKNKMKASQGVHPRNGLEISWNLTQPDKLIKR